ncbi:MAG: YesL family protein [Lachnospiraceae bacterium]|nr:YesL family protein [Lachnospiraceae bacterium]
MVGIFNYDSGVINILNKLTDFVCLFVLWLLFSVPIVTFGASTSAFYYTFRKVIIKERGYLWRSFIHSFKDNFKQATGMFILQIVIGTILALNCYCLLLFRTVFNDVLCGVFFGCIAIVYNWTRFWFPYISCIEDKTKIVLKNCGQIMVRNIPWSLLLIAMFAGHLYLMYMYPHFCLLISAVYMALNGIVFNRVLNKYLPQDSEIEDENIESDENN